MPDTTDNGLPYPLASDPFSVGNEDIQALAEAVDPHLELPFLTWTNLSSAGYSMAASTWVDLAGASGSGYDIAKSSHFAAGLSPFTYVGPDWWFLASAYATFDTNGVAGSRKLRILRNADVVGFAQLPAGASDTGAVETCIATAHLVKLVSGDVVQAEAWQDSGSINLQAYSGFALSPIRPV